MCVYIYVYVYNTSVGVPFRQVVGCALGSNGQGEMSLEYFELISIFLWVPKL